MLKKFYVDNFKTHINTVYEPSPVNLLLGMNNSGKTNLCQAIRFVGLTSHFPLETAAEAVNETWSLANVYFDKETIDFRVEADLIFEGEKVSYVYDLSLDMVDPVTVPEDASKITVHNEKLAFNAPGFENTPLIINESGNVQLLDEPRGEGQDRIRILTTAPTDATMLSRLYDLKKNPRSNLFKRYLESWFYYDINPQQLRHPGARTLEPILNPDGDNLASVLFLLKNADERLYRRLIDITKKAIEPRLELLSFFSPALNQVFMYGEDSAGNRFGHRTMSNGALRFLALAYLLLGKHGGNKTGGSRLILIEEPETGLYAGHLKELFSLIDTSGENGQFIFTSHSPYFIDLFDGLLEGVTLAKRGQTHSQLVKPDTEKLRKMLEQMPLGEIYFREMLAL